jgi:hypothetical protein
MVLDNKDERSMSFEKEMTILFSIWEFLNLGVTKFGKKNTV